MTKRYCKVKASEPGALEKWNKPTEAISLITSNDVHRFLNYCLKLKRGRDNRHLKGIKKASALKADWKSFRSYYREVTRQSINPELSEEINTVIHSASNL